MTDVAKAREELLRLIGENAKPGRFGVVAITLAVENLIKAAEARGGTTRRPTRTGTGT